MYATVLIMRKSTDDLSVYNSPETAVVAVIDDYYEVYIVNAINFLRQQFSDKEIHDILESSLDEEYTIFKKQLEGSILNQDKKYLQVEKISAIYYVLQRMLSGTLTVEDSMMIALRKVAPAKKIEELNALVKEKITIAILLPELKLSSEYMI